MYYEARVLVTRINEKGESRQRLEHYVVKDVLLFAEAEAKAMCSLPGQGGNPEVTSLVRSKVRELVNDIKDELPDGERVYRATLTQTYTNEAGKEVEMHYPVLVRAESLAAANLLTSEYIKQGLDDMSLDSIVATKILGVI